MDKARTPPSEFTMPTLRSNPLFSSLSPEALEALADEAHEKGFGAGQLIFEATSPGDTFYAVSKGAVQIFLGQNSENETVLHELGENEYFGELCILERGERWASARAVRPTVLVKISRDTFEEFRRLWPEQHLLLVSNLCRELVRRMKSNGDRMSDASRLAMWGDSPS